jgi:hypothetical protein
VGFSRIGTKHSNWWWFSTVLAGYIGPGQASTRACTQVSLDQWAMANKKIRRLWGWASHIANLCRTLMFRVRFNFSFSHFVVELPLQESMSSIITMDTSMHNGKEGQNLLLLMSSSWYHWQLLIKLCVHRCKNICFLAFVLHFLISSFLSLCFKSWKVFC